MENSPVDTKVTTCVLLICSQCHKKTDMLFDAKCLDCYIEDSFLDVKFFESKPAEDFDETESKFWKGD